jgi:hypothetical protein
MYVVIALAFTPAAIRADANVWRASWRTGRFLQVNRECPRQESNLCTRFRKPLLYPLSYGGQKPCQCRASVLAYGTPLHVSPPSMDVHCNDRTESTP